ncbi:helix-turn-helix domain-containing protein, partial [Pseudonocardia pini]|uniref:helix-turn-helix domain-containing protein n=1 Tax=Pseudonocardia pini TaxID=2758030 RepID=UPI00406BC28E
TGLVAEPWPDDPLAALVHACHLLREHRGDSHLAVCAVAGLDPVAMNVLTELYCGYRAGEYTATRGWSPDRVAQTLADLREQGLLEGELLSAGGLRFRSELEARTDALQRSVVEAIGPELGSITKQLDEWSDALVAAGAAPPDPAKRLAG